MARWGLWQRKEVTLWQEQPLLSFKKLGDTELLLLELPVLYEMPEIWLKPQNLLSCSGNHGIARGGVVFPAPLSWRLHGVFALCAWLGGGPSFLLF